MKKKYWVFILIMSLGSAWGFGQSILTLDSSQSKMVIKGDSTLHEWEMNAEEFSGQANIQENQISAILFSAEAEGLESGKGKMNKLTYEALKSDKHPQITFDVTHVEINENEFILHGKMNIAGVEKEISLKTLGLLKQNELKINGSYLLDMTSYDMIPPKAVFGTIVVEKEIEVVFDLTFKQE